MTTEPDGEEEVEETIEDLEAPATEGDNVVGGALPREPGCKTSTCSPSCLGASCSASDSFCFGTTQTHDMVVWEK